MDNEKVYEKSIISKYPTESDDSDFDSDGGWESFYIADNVPESYKTEDGIEIENLTSIEIRLSDPEVNWEYEDNSFYEDFGLGPQRCDPGSGYGIEDASIGTEVAFTIEGDEISRERYMEINNISDEELSIITKHLEGLAEEHWCDWAQDHLDPPEPYDPREDYDPYDDY